MYGYDALFLARAQFAFTVGFHIVLPAFSIGLASYLMVLEALWLRTGKQVYLDVFRSWLKIFALSFAMGVVSGLVMSYEFGTNWGAFADKAGPVVGPLMGYEVLTAFFLEAGFLGVMLFGMNRVGRGLHFLATVLVAIGTLISAFWILAVNSWMQTPAGYVLSPEGRFLPASWLASHLQPLLPVSPRAHGARVLSQRRLLRGRGWSLPSAPQFAERRRANDVLDGHVDGRDRRPDPNRCRRHSRHEYARASAGEDRGASRGFRVRSPGSR